eukprot:Amastigsp_a339201_5162.p3 type:complete len:113 gc:universal Amastigsp_a339201_5162:1-339(+)
MGTSLFLRQRLSRAASKTSTHTRTHTHTSRRNKWPASLWTWKGHRWTWTTGRATTTPTKWMQRTLRPRLRLWLRKPKPWRFPGLCLRFLRCGRPSLRMVGTSSAASTFRRIG